MKTAEHVHRIKLISLLFLPLVLLAALFNTYSYAADIPSPDRCFYVNDFADVISVDTKEYICDKVSRLEDKTGAQVLVVTVTGLDGENIERYCRSLFNNWGIGSSKENNGILFLMALAEDDYWAMLGSGLENSFGNGTLGLILDYYVEDYFVKQDYDGAAKAFTDITVEKLCKIYNIVDDTDTESVTHNDTEGFKLSIIIGALIFFLIIFFIIRLVFRFISGILRGVFGIFIPRPPRYFGGNHYYRDYGGRWNNNTGYRGRTYGGSNSGFGSSHNSSSHSGGGGFTRGGGAGRGRR